MTQSPGMIADISYGKAIEYLFANYPHNLTVDKTYPLQQYMEADHFRVGVAPKDVIIKALNLTINMRGQLNGLPNIMSPVFDALRINLEYLTHHIRTSGDPAKFKLDILVNCPRTLLRPQEMMTLTRAFRPIVERFGRAIETKCKVHNTSVGKVEFCPHRLLRLKKKDWDKVINDL